MKKSTLKVLAVLAMCSLLFVSTANAVTESTDDPYTDTDTFSVTLEGSVNQDGYIDLSWNQYDGVLKWYKVVHSQTNPEAYYPVDGYVQAIGDPAVTTYTHTGVQIGTNYYRVCTINADYLRSCSNTLTFEIAEVPGETTIIKEPVSSDPYTDDSSIVMTLTGNLNSLGKAELNWNEYAEGDLKWYKIVHSQTNPEAYYPVDGYVAVYSDASQTSYLHTSVPEGTNHYRVCVITTDNRRGCSNTVTLEKGAGNIPIFSDIETHWAKEYVEDLAADGVVVGKDGNFEPDTPVLRAEAIKMIMIGLGFDEVTCDSTIFPDLGSDDWFCGIVTKAHKKGVVTGDNGMLYPGRNINRAEAVKILLMVQSVEPPVLDFNPFSDVDYLQWYAGYVYKANILGYVDGIDGEFQPSRDITRAELAKIVSLASN
jgi:hypothetical protein